MNRLRQDGNGNWKATTHGRLSWPPKSDVVNQWNVRRAGATQEDDGSEVTSQKSKHKTNTPAPPPVAPDRGSFMTVIDDDWLARTWRMELTGLPKARITKDCRTVDRSANICICERCVTHPEMSRTHRRKTPTHAHTHRHRQGAVSEGLRWACSTCCMPRVEWIKRGLRIGS